MVQISHETTEQTENRLRKVISETDFKVYAGAYAFEEFPLAKFNDKVNQNALCLIRDEEVWSQLIPSDDQSKELFQIFSFHFDECKDNSGFIGWLANHLKARLGTGLFVTCGQNTNRDGIFDYWGCPLALGDKAVAEVQKLIEDGKNL
ncbi:DUF6196 family protein [Ostreibacterium oceani]|uniref:Uncharacterized protein n=1 Tax=Ostreibacterium oceani TaxID=2654998 RepID=A0A6N7EX52_9GAMM|nr:DUF6196 family protein [Ostreibacterium oceani]MPV85989.1 hypothetical protein [Ostreibacterium oceani]